MADEENKNIAKSPTSSEEVAAMQDYGKKLLTYAAWAFMIVSFVLLFSIVIGAFMTSKSNESIDFIRVNKSIQITMGMICGLLFAFFGVALSWAGIRASFNGTINSDKFSATINTASPGIVMMICGTVLIAISVTRDVTTKRSISYPKVSLESYNMPQHNMEKPQLSEHVLHEQKITNPRANNEVRIVESVDEVELSEQEE